VAAPADLAALGLLAAAYAGADLAFNAVKELVHRARPPAGILLKPVAGPSFPSGHATQAVAVYGMLAALAAATTTSWARKVAAWALAVVITGAVAVSRLYLGAHWLTDVLGGLALGAAWLFALLTSVRTMDQLHSRSADRGPPAATEPDDPAAPTRSTPARRSPAAGGPHG
jgi:membrane-associated phospholipid phosphatase